MGINDQDQDPRNADRIRREDEDVEGHISPRDAEDVALVNPDADDDVEGHYRNMVDPDADDDVEGHYARDVALVNPDADQDVEGHKL